MSSHRLTKSGHYIPQHQYSELPPNLKIETLTIPSSAPLSWGSQCNIDVREKNITVLNATLEMLPSVISGLTGSVANFPNLNPASLWFQRIEFLIGGKVSHTIYGTSQFVKKQLFLNDSDRLQINYGEGLYSSAAQRNAIVSSSANGYVYIDLWGAFKTAKIPLVFNHDIQVRIYMDTLANQVNVSTLTGTPVQTFISCNLLLKVVRSDHHINLKNAIAKTPHSYKFLDCRVQSFTIPSGSTSFTQILNAFQGCRVPFLYFVLRSSTQGTGQFTFSPISSYEIFGADGQNVVGGTSITSNNALYSLSRDWIQSSYFTETGNSPYVYFYSWSEDPVQAHETAVDLGHLAFRGSEKLKINFSSATGSALTVDVFAYVNSVIKISSGTVDILVE